MDSSEKADYDTYNEVLGLFEEFKVVLASTLVTVNQIWNENRSAGPLSRSLQLWALIRRVSVDSKKLFGSTQPNYIPREVSDPGAGL